MFESWLSKSAEWRRAVGLVLGTVLLCIYYPVFRFDYLYHDDWVFFNDRASLADSRIDDWSRIGGRPLERYLLRGLFLLVGTVETAWLARLVIVGGIVAFAFLQSMYFQGLGINWATAAAMALGTSVLPGMLVFGYWITAGSIVFSLLASVAAAILTANGLQPGTDSTRRAAFLVGACAFETAALLLYQTAAMYFWTLSAVMLATMASKGLRSAICPLVAYALVGAGPMAGYFIWFRYLSGLAPVLAAADPQRGRMFRDVAESAKWFFSAVLPNASLLWFFDLPRGFGVAVLLLCVSFLILFSARMCLLAWRKGDRMESFLCAAYPLVMTALSLGAFFPMLVTGFHLEVFRSLIPLSALIFLTGTIHLGAALRTAKWPPVIKTCLACGFVVILSCFANQSLIGRMVLPAAAEYSYVRNSVREAAQRPRMPDRVQAVAPRQRPKFDTDEIDNLSVQDVGPMIQAIGRELGLHLGPVSVSLQGESFNGEGALVVDFGELSKSGLWKPASARKPIPLWTYGDSYDLFVRQDLIYAVPRSMGPVNWEGGTVGNLTGVVTGATVADVISHLRPDTTMNPQPILLSSHQGYNLVAYRARVYGVPQAVGRLDLVDWESGRVGKLPGVIIENTVEEVLARLPK